VLREYPIATMAEGDVYIMNDPYDGGTHLPDINILMPVFWRGRLVAIASCMAHQQDMGGMVIGSLPPDATELFQEGLVLPPVKLMEKGEFNRQVLNIILKTRIQPTLTDWRGRSRRSGPGWSGSGRSATSTAPTRCSPSSPS
jgi:N-methylhydantoinase B